MSEPLILIDPHPRTLAQICDAPTRRRLEALGRLVVHEDGPMPAAMVEQHLPEAELIFGQTDLPAERLARAAKLRAIVNVETNFLPTSTTSSASSAASTSSRRAAPSRLRWPRRRWAWRSISRAGSRWPTGRFAPARSCMASRPTRS